MSLNLEFKKLTLQFKFDAGTSRGVLKTKDSWLIKVYDTNDPKTVGHGEISTIERLSFDYSVDFENELLHLAESLKKENIPSTVDEIYSLVNRIVESTRPAIRFGLETALLDLMNGGEFKIFDNYFFEGNKGIPINGLVWMGDESFMREQIHQKIEAGFKCIKLKIGAIDFESECKILKSIRKKYSPQELVLRVDANGAFLTQDVLKKLEDLSEFDLHSIEQPIMPHQLHSLRLMCKKSEVPIALDEELIGVFYRNEKVALLEQSKPSYIVLKPSILGGFQATAEWIEIAESMEVGWWITSALESNIGLNAICQFAAEYDIQSHQGLGTGQLYENNIHSPLVIKGEEIFYHKNMSWDHSSLEF